MVTKHSKVAKKNTNEAARKERERMIKARKGQRGKEKGTEIRQRESKEGTENVREKEHRKSTEREEDQGRERERRSRWGASWQALELMHR